MIVSLKKAMCLRFKQLPSFYALYARCSYLIEMAFDNDTITNIFSCLEAYFIIIIIIRTSVVGSTHLTFLNNFTNKANMSF